MRFLSRTSRLACLWSGWFTAAVTWIGLVASGTSLCSAQQKLDDPVLRAWLRFEETYACQSCHYESDPVPAGRPDDFSPSERGDFSRQNEMHRWVREDKHAIARIRVEPLRPAEIEAERERMLKELAFDDARRVNEWLGPSNELSRRICDAMHIDVESEAGYREFAQQCLNCHGGYRDTPENRARFAKPDSLASAQPGISCLDCHQDPDADTETEWIIAHAGIQDRNRSWRIKPPAEKAQAGMRDLVTTSNQANLCNDCHIGNLQKGMFVSHTMYAAGHPPLPNMELETFCRSMPQHWRSLSELQDAMEEAEYPEKDTYFAVNFPGLAEKLETSSNSFDDVYWNTRKLLVGAAAARRRSAEMVLWAAEQEGVWGDYALYDCSACHHELERPSLRQQRGYPGAPGRPRLPEWPEVLVRLIAPPTQATALANERLRQTVSAVPFGNPLECKTAAEPLVALLNSNVERLESSAVLTAGTTLTVIDRLSRADEAELIDYLTARQVMWGIMVAAEELAVDPELSAEGRSILAAVQAEIALWTAPARAEGRLVSSGAVGIATELPAGRNMFIFRENLSEELDRRSRYRPADLAKSLQRIQTAFATPAASEGTVQK